MAIPERALDPALEPQPASASAPAPGFARWIVPTLTVLAMSGSTAVFVLVPFASDDVAVAVLGATAFGGGLVLAVANVVQAVVMAVSKRPGLLAFSRRAMLLVKLGLMPFYLVGAVVLAALGVMSILPFGIMLPFVAIGPLVTFGWFVLACCSAWTFAYAAGLWRAGLLSSGACAASCILSLFFVADVACAVALFACGRKRERMAAASRIGGVA